MPIYILFIIINNKMQNLLRYWIDENILISNLYHNELSDLSFQSKNKMEIFLLFN
jgi:hypothetical protein